MKHQVPLVGAKVFIEPGQTATQINIWFKRLKEAEMYITRIRMFENYMRKPDGTWNYTLFDYAFKAGEKYGIKIFLATMGLSNKSPPLKS